MVKPVTVLPCVVSVVKWSTRVETCILRLDLTSLTLSLLVSLHSDLRKCFYHFASFAVSVGVSVNVCC